MPKFKVGDWVMMENVPEIKMRVLEISEFTCSGGKQIHYFCRQFMKRYEGSWVPAGKKSGNGATIEIFKYNEFEIVPFVEEKKA